MLPQPFLVLPKVHVRVGSSDRKVPVIVDPTYTLSQYLHSTDNNNFKRISNNNNNHHRQLIINIDSDVCRDGISPHILTQYNNQISSISINMVNSNKNSITSLDIRFIGYFYYVFPLHLNIFNRLFSDIINPKLSILISSVCEFISLISKIDSFKEDLNGVSKYLNVNPAQELMNLTGQFSGDSYVKEVKEHINGMVQELEKLDVKSKYHQIISDANSIIRRYNQGLKTRFENFKKKIKNHKKSLEEKIKQYIQNINESLTNDRSCVQEFIKSIKNIESQITKFAENYRKIGLSSSYILYTNLIKTREPNSENVRLTSDEISIISKISKSVRDYRNASHIFNSRKRILSQNLSQFKIYSHPILNIVIQEPLSKENYSSYISLILSTLQNFEPRIDKLLKYIDNVQKLQEIGSHITTMKTELGQVKGKVEDEAVKYINGLENITITHSDIESRIKNIKSVNESVIARLKIAKHTIEFYKSLEGELGKLNVDFNDYDFTLYLTVKQKVTSFESQIKNAINKIKGDIDKINSNLFSPHYKTQVEQDYTSDIPNIKSLINNSLDDIKMIKHILKVLQQIKENSPDISEIKSKVSGMSNLSDANSKLPDAVKGLKKFLELQTNTRNLIETFKLYPKFSTLGQFSNELQDSIFILYRLIGYMELSNKLLNGVGHTDFLIKWIKPYNPWFETIQKIIQNFNLYVDVIITRLQSINSNLCQLQSTLSKCCPGYNTVNTGRDCTSTNTHFQPIFMLSKLKDYMRYLKFYVRNIRENFDVISVVVDKIKKESRHIDTHKRVYERLEKYIHCHICYIKCNNKNDVLKESVVKQLEEIKDRLNDIIRIIMVIGKFRGLQFIADIECRLKCVESSVSELECAIEGVPTNLIRCSLLSTSNHLINHNLTTNWDRQGNNIGGLEMNIVIKNLISRIVIDESIFVMLMLNMYSKIKSEISKVLPMLEHCICIDVFEQYYINSVCPYHKSLPDLSNTDTINWDMVQNDVHNKENDSCSCMIIRYRLIPEVYLTIRYSGYFYFDLLSTLDRQFNKYVLTEYDKLLIFKLVYLLINLIHKITLWMRYLYEEDVRKGYCFCNRYDKSFIHLKLMIIKICELMENTWSMDPETIRMSIEKLSTLMSQLDKIDSDVSKNTSNNSNSLDLLSKIIVASFDVTNISTGLIFESVKFLGYYFRLIIALLPTQSLTVILIYQYLFNIIFSINNLGFRIHNLYRILKLSVNTIISNFVLIGKLFNSDGIKCDCKNKICPCKIIILTSSKIIDEKIGWVKKNVINNNRLYTIKESKNSELKKKFVEINIKYNKLGITLVKKTSISHRTGLNCNKTKVSGVRNWGYYTRYEHQATNNNSSYNYRHLLNTLNNNENTLRKLHYFSSLLGSSVDRNFSLVSSSCLEISS